MFKLTTDVVRDAVLEHWLATGEAAMPADVAERLGRGVAAVRRHLNASTIPSGIWACDTEVAVRDSSYRNIIGYRRAVGYKPSDQLLRDTILGLQAMLRGAGVAIPEIASVR